MLRVLLACLALVALARAGTATAACNGTATCVSSGSDCTGTGDFCAEGLYCDSTCKTIPGLTGDCSISQFQTTRSGSDTGCFDSASSYAPVCSGGKCMWAALYGPGESCSSDTTNYVNGGCAAGLTCTSGKCTGSGNGDACANNCTVGLYCTTNGTCAARKTSGASCTTSIECDPTLICTNHGSGAATCQAPFSQAETQSCANYFDCQSGLWCTGGTCSKFSGTDGSDCSDDGSCPDNQECVCHSDKSGNTVSIVGPGTCRLVDPTNTKSLINDWNNFQSCAKSNGCFDYFALTGFGISLGGPNQCISKCASGAFGSNFAKISISSGKCDFSTSSGSSAAIFPSFVAIVALFVYAIFA